MTNTVMCNIAASVLSVWRLIHWSTIVTTDISHRCRGVIEERKQLKSQSRNSATFTSKTRKGKIVRQTIDGHLFRNGLQGSWGRLTMDFTYSRYQSTQGFWSISTSFYLSPTYFLGKFIDRSLICRNICRWLQSLSLLLGMVRKTTDGPSKE